MSYPRRHLTAPARLRVREVRPGDQVASATSFDAPALKVVSHLTTGARQVNIWFTDGTRRSVRSWDVFVTAHRPLTTTTNPEEHTP